MGTCLQGTTSLGCELYQNQSESNSRDPKQFSPSKTFSQDRYTQDGAYNHCEFSYCNNVTDLAELESEKDD